MPRMIHVHTEIYPNLKNISELFKMYTKSLNSFILASRDNGVSCSQTLGCLRLYGDIRVSRSQSRINAYEILLQHDWLLFFSRHNRVAETHRHLQLSYHITDRLLAAGNKSGILFNFLFGQMLNPIIIMSLWHVHINILSSDTLSKTLKKYDNTENIIALYQSPFIHVY